MEQECAKNSKASSSSEPANEAKLMANKETLINIRILLQIWVQKSPGAP